MYHFAKKNTHLQWKKPVTISLVGWSVKFPCQKWFAAKEWIFDILYNNLWSIDVQYFQKKILADNDNSR